VERLWYIIGLFLLELVWRVALAGGDFAGSAINHGFMQSLLILTLTFPCTPCSFYARRVAGSVEPLPWHVTSGIVLRDH
jgi:hypothetical protein